MDLQYASCQDCICSGPVHATSSSWKALAGPATMIRFMIPWTALGLSRWGTGPAAFSSTCFLFVGGLGTASGRWACWARAVTCCLTHTCFTVASTFWSCSAKSCFACCQSCSQWTCSSAGGGVFAIHLLMAKPAMSRSVSTPIASTATRICGGIGSSTDANVIAWPLWQCVPLCLRATRETTNCLSRSGCGWVVLVAWCFAG